ncbi:hypothetical protein [Roseiflexus castenholzii]|uniref:Uncharacterized protein n=1 Tax=Roseiflexus castenholzii (strain DSM 13941 / HLO8) TaxID=383372 RepID=A7NJ18_ROSCS|nr:hypothetical protein [Roseiflexus castenholzii]ABU57484.1 conserved hypothetical protein [Roseiflexus castenholzii DSM 13941]
MSAREPVILCELSEETERLINDYAEALKAHAPRIGDHGMNNDEFWQSGPFRAAIERLRGTQAATTSEKREFIEKVLDFLKQQGKITDWKFSGSGERHDYEVRVGDRICVIEAKGCLDGNNTNTFQRPANADEFIIWSLCQNPGSDPRHNAWSGIHTRLSAEMISRKERVDGLIIWDMLCGTKGRICPNLTAAPGRAAQIDATQVPPPCLYLFPRTVPDARNNPAPQCWKINEVEFLKILYDAFQCDAQDVVEIGINVQMSGPDVARKTIWKRGDNVVAESQWTKIKRAQ